MNKKLTHKQHIYNSYKPTHKSKIAKELFLFLRTVEMTIFIAR